jgi:hypothetical protein
MFRPAVSVFSAGAVIIASAARAQGTPAAIARTKPALEVTLIADKPSYTLSDKITLHVLLTNNSHSVLYLHAPLQWGWSADLMLSIFDAASGKEIFMKVLEDAIPPPPRSKKEFVPVLPEHIFGTVRTDSFDYLGIMKSGTYRFVVEFLSSIPTAAFAFGLPTWSRDKGWLRSNDVTITVTE